MPVISQKAAMMTRTMMIMRKMIMRMRTTMVMMKRRMKLKKHEIKCLPLRMVPHAQIDERVLIGTLTVKVEATVEATTTTPLTLQPFIHFKSQSQNHTHAKVKVQARIQVQEKVQEKVQVQVQAQKHV